MITFTPALISQIAETVYGQLAREAAPETEMANWAHLAEDDRESYLARIFAWITHFRIGNRLEHTFTDREAALTWQFSEQIMGKDWAWMTGQGIRLERLSDAVMTKAEAQLGVWKLADSPKSKNGESGLQKSVSAGEGEAPGEDRSEQGGDSPGGGDENSSADARRHRKSARQLES